MTENDTLGLPGAAYRWVWEMANHWAVWGSVAVCALPLLLYWGLHHWRWSLECMRDPACPLPLPPGSMGWPLIGETLEFVRKGGEFFASRLARYGPVYKTHLIGSPTVRLVGAEHVRCVLSSDSGSVRSFWPRSVQRLMGPRSLVALSSEEHRKVKPIISAIFTPSVLASFVPRMQTLVDKHLDLWCRTSAAKGQVLAFPSCLRLTLDFGLEIILGRSQQGAAEDDSLHRSALQFVDNLFSLPFAIPGCGMWKGLKARERLIQEVRDRLDRAGSRQDVEGEVGDHEEGEGDHGDFLSIVELLQQQPDLSHQRQLIEDNALQMFFASYSTTSSALCSAIMCIGGHPEVLQRVEAELGEEGLLQDPGRELTYTLLDRLRYVHAFNSEVLRLFPPAGAVFRKACRTLQIGGYQVPKDWVVACSIRETQQTSRLFPDSELFLPERWLRMTAEDREKSRFQYLPFGSGTHVCSGRRLVELLQALFLVQLVRRCHVTLRNPRPPMMHLPVVKAKDGLPATFTSRLQTSSGSSSSSPATTAPSAPAAAPVPPPPPAPASPPIPSSPTPATAVAGGSGAGDLQDSC